jgi:hypothetical protein
MAIGGDYDPDYDDEIDYDDPLCYPDGEGGWIDMRYDGADPGHHPHDDDVDDDDADDWRYADEPEDDADEDDG